MRKYKLLVLANILSLIATFSVVVVVTNRPPKFKKIYDVRDLMKYDANIDWARAIKVYSESLNNDGEDFKSLDASLTENAIEVSAIQVEHDNSEKELLISSRSSRSLGTFLELKKPKSLRRENEGRYEGRRLLEERVVIVSHLREKKSSKSGQTELRLM